MSLYSKTLMCTGSVLFLAGFLAGCSTPENGVVARASQSGNQTFVDSADRCRGELISIEVQRKLRLGHSKQEISAWLRSSCRGYTANLDGTEIVSRNSGSPSEAVSEDAPDNNAGNDGNGTSSGGGAGLSEASESDSGAGGSGPSGNGGSSGSEGGASGSGSGGQGSDSTDGGSSGGAGGHGNGGHGNSGNGGGHANNGGGNGSEGSSPGQGHGANNDERG